MKRPWQIWTLYLLCLSIVLPAIAWLTIKALELDRAEALARRQAEVEEDISRALWRMDARLTPLLAQEAARPHFVYRAFYAEPNGNGPDDQRPLAASPLLMQPSDFVMLHFQLRSDDQITSPQCPTDLQCQWAIQSGASQDGILLSSQRLAQLQGQIHHAELLAKLPADTLKPGVVSAPAAANSIAAVADEAPLFVKNTADLSRVQQQLDSAQANSSQGNTQQAASPQPSGQWGQAESSGYQSGRLQRSQSRLGNDLQSRDAVYQAYAQKEAVEQRLNLPAAPPPQLVTEGVSQPLWIGSRLLLARRVIVGEEVVIQGCWLDWPKIRALLCAEVADLLPRMELEPVVDDGQIKVSRLLATLPVQLIVPPAFAEPAPLSPIRISLVVAWACLLLAAAAVAVLLQGVMTLSERRAAFVSAVTHELRTPLTTFRMYAEMLRDGMVPDGLQRQQYLETLHAEANRLSHLVENVLSYARLERSRPNRRRDAVTIEALLDRVQSRLEDRARQAGMQLVVEADETARAVAVRTDPAAVEQILFNLVDNACKYAASSGDPRIHLQIKPAARCVEVCISDHGPGINGRQAKRLFQPFCKSATDAANSAPGVGLGLALARRLAHDLGGRLQFQPNPSAGAAFALVLPRAT